MLRRTLTSLTLLFLALGSHAADPKPEPKPQPKPAPSKPEPKPDPAKPEPKPEPKPQPPQPEPKPQPAPTPTKDELPKPAAASTPAQASTPKPAEDSKPKKKSVADFTKDFKRIDGLFRMYLDMEKGAPWLYIAKSQLGPEFIYFNHSVDGPVGAGHNRGRYGEETIIVLRKIFDRVEFIESNTSIYFDPQSPLARARNANISPAVLASESIAAEDADGVLISATNLFLREALTMVKFGEKSLLGRLSEPKTKVLRINGYPKNTAVIAEYVFENQNPPHEHDEDITDGRYISVQVQHTLLAMPETDFKPRLDDPRIGYFTHQITDMTSLDAAPYRDAIHRWNLVKQKPGTALSEPVEPIVFWIENTTPVEFRDTIRAAVLKWNEAFETAGFKDAVVVKQQPDDAKWDAGDIDHNVLRWTSSVNPPFGGYGPSFANPRTGQILGADIMLEYSYITKRLLTKKLFDDLGLATEQPAEGASKANPHACLACNCARQGIQFGQTMLRMQKSDRIEVDRLVKESLYYLALHEVGHTLGLNHNFRSSHLHSPENIHNAEVTEKTGLTGSVMDYPPVNLAPKGIKQGQYFTTKPGPYDHWAINYGYSESLEDPIEEAKRLEAITSQSHKPELAFANDADDMRGIGKAIDPRAMLFDMSSDPIAYGEHRCDMAKGELKNVLKDLAEPGKSWQEVSQAYMSLTKEVGNALTAISRYIGGVYVERAVQGQAQGVAPFKPVEAEKQRRALAALAKHAFAPDALSAPPELYAHLQQQRRGFDHGDESEDPKLHDIAFRLQSSLLAHLLHPTTLQRLQDSSLYGNEVSVDEVLTALTTAICTGDDPAKPVSTMRQNLQLDYLTRLLSLAHSGSFSHATQSSALLQIESIKALPFANTPAHQLAIKYRIRRALDEK
jgi:hypothetical protein